MIIGAIWYGPLFGKVWPALSSMTPEGMATAKAKGMAKPYAINFVGALVMAYVFAHVLAAFGNALGTSGWVAGLQGGFFMWLGFVAPLLLGSILWENKTFKLYAINAGYYLVLLIVNGIIIACWQ